MTVHVRDVTYRRIHFQSTIVFLQFVRVYQFLHTHTFALTNPREISRKSARERDM